MRLPYAQRDLSWSPRSDGGLEESSSSSEDEEDGRWDLCCRGGDGRRSRPPAPALPLPASR